MKIRSCLVSNSSTGSFIVRVRDPKNNQEFLTKEQQELLLNNMFFPTTCASPIYLSSKSTIDIDDPAALYLGFLTVVNEDEIIDFLLRNKISFRASCHYDDYAVIYNADKDQVIVADNVASAILDRYFPILEEADLIPPWTKEDYKPIRYYTAQEYLEKIDWQPISFEDDSYDIIDDAQEWLDIYKEEVTNKTE